MLASTEVDFSPTQFIGLVLVTAVSMLGVRLIKNIYFHPLSQFPGPWYASATSLPNAIISLLKAEPRWLLGLTKKYGTSKPIRIAPNLLLFPRPSALRDIYWDHSLNYKSGMYSTGALGPPSLFSTQDGKAHQNLRKALGGNQWSIGFLKKMWESRFDDQINLFLSKVAELANKKQEVILSDKVAEFAADIMTLVSFTEPWGFVRNGRDERGMLESWRVGLPFYGLAGRWRWFRRNILTNDRLAKLFLPTVNDKKGMGYLYAHADRAVSNREKMKTEGFSMEKPDYLEYCVEAKNPSTGEPLTPVQKRAHITLLIQAGADTTGTGLGSTLRNILLDSRILAKVRDEIDAVHRDGKLSNPIAYDETRELLPYVSACIKESLRLNPPIPNLFPRVIPSTGKEIDGVKVPPHMDVTSMSYIVQRDPELYAPDPETYRPERWLEADAQKASEMDAAQFVFGMGPRICLGKDIAIMELWKLIPQMVHPGEYIVAGGIAYNQGLRVRMEHRTIKPA